MYGTYIYMFNTPYPMTVGRMAYTMIMGIMMMMSLETKAVLGYGIVS